MATYYIDPVGGDNGNSGASGAPWRTITYGIATCSNNDTLRLRSGVFVEGNLTTFKTGITLMADTGHTPIWTLATARTSWSKTGGATNVYETSDMATVGNLWGVWHGGDKLTGTANVPACDVLANSYYLDDPANMLYVNIGGGAPTEIYCSEWATFLLTIWGAGWVIDGIIIQYGVQGIECKSDTLVRGCTSRYWTEVSGEWNPFIVSGSGASFLNCSLAGAAYPGAVIRCTSASSNVTVKNCTCTKGQWMVMILGGSGHLIEDCIISNMTGDGIGVDGGSANVTIRRVVVRDSSHGGFWINGNAFAQLEYCVAYLTSDIGGGALYGFIADPGASANFYHCTVAHHLRSSSGNRAGFWINTAGTVNLKNCVEHNNSVGMNVTVGCGVILDADYNCISSGYQGDAVAGAHNVDLPPAFVSDAASHDDFHLLPVSPCIDAGVPLPGVNDGFRGKAPDMGAFEYVRPGRHGRR